MRSERRRPSRRELAIWTVAVAVPLGLGTGLLLPMTANAAVDLPDLTPAELVEFAAASEVDALSGTIEQSSELGLPDLGALGGALGGGAGGPGVADGAGDAGAGQPADLDDLVELVTGSHTAKVYLDGAKARLQVLDRLAERNVYVDGDARAAWFVDSETETATHLTVPEGAEHAQHVEPAVPMPTPDELLDESLARLDETTEVTVGTDGRVADRDVYELVLEPRTADTLVGEVRFAIDGENGAALAASVTARGAEQPAFSIAFTEVSFDAPDASVFVFSPAAGFAVVEKELPVPSADELARWQATSEHPATDAADHPRLVVHGEGWSAVVELPNTSEGGATAFEGLDPETAELLDSVTQAVDGGRALQTSLVSVLLTDDGRVLAGAVPVERLVEAAQAGR